MAYSVKNKIIKTYQAKTYAKEGFYEQKSVLENSL
jgi:hypothetical protein